MWTGTAQSEQDNKLAYLDKVVVLNRLQRCSLIGEVERIEDVCVPRGRLVSMQRGADAKPCLSALSWGFGPNIWISSICSSIVGFPHSLSTVLPVLQAELVIQLSTSTNIQNPYLDQRKSKQQKPAIPRELRSGGKLPPGIDSSQP